MPPKTPRVRAAVYLRISLDATGDGLALDRQREDCLKIAKRRRWSVVREFRDTVSAYDKRKARPQYDQLVAAYEAGEFDALVCWDLDRLTRQPGQLEHWIDAAEDRGLLLVTANGEADLSTDGGRMYARIKAAVARAESERKAERQRRAAVQRSEIGRPPLGVRLTGYTVRGDVVPEEAAVVRQVFQRFAAGDSLRSLTAWLAQSGVSTRHGARWNPSSVRTMLMNPRYAGRAIYNGQETGKPGAWTAIIDNALFDVVQSRLTDPRRKTAYGTDRKHLGSGLYACVCGAKVRAWSGNRYRCANACVARSQEPVDRFVLDVIRGRLARPDLADLIAPSESPEARQLAEQIKGLRARLVRIADDYDAGHIDGQRYKIATEKARAELGAAEAAQARMSGGSAVSSILLAADPVAKFDAAPLMIRRTVIDVLCTVQLHGAPRGRKTFDPNSVKIIWKKSGTAAA